MILITLLTLSVLNTYASEKLDLSFTIKDPDFKHVLKINENGEKLTIDANSNIFEFSNNSSVGKFTIDSNLVKKEIVKLNILNEEIKIIDSALSKHGVDLKYLDTSKNNHAIRIKFNQIEVDATGPQYKKIQKLVSAILRNKNILSVDTRSYDFNTLSKKDIINGKEKNKTSLNLQNDCKRRVNSYYCFDNKDRLFIYNLRR